MITNSETIFSLAASRHPLAEEFRRDKVARLADIWAMLADDQNTTADQIEEPKP